MAMSRKDYETIALAFKNEVRHGNGYGLSDRAATVKLALCNVAADLAHEFALDNTNFDRQRFLTACGF